MAVTFQGRTRAEGWRHVDHDHNPHAHVLLIDVDENGEHVANFGRSGSWRRENSPVKGNPTVWLRKAWEDECNTVLEANGYDFRIDRRTKLEQTIERQQAQKHSEFTEREISVENDRPDPENLPSGKLERKGDKLLAPECPPMPVDAPPEADTVDDLSEPEDDMVTVEKLPPKQAVFVASEFYTELRELRHLRSRLEGFTEATESAAKQLATAERESTAAFVAKASAEKQKFAAEEALKQFQTDRGLKGFGVSIGIGKWKLEWKTALRKEGEQALSSFEALSSAYERAEHAERSTAAQVERWDNQKKGHESNRDAAQHQVDTLLSQNGDRATLESAEHTLNHSAHAYLEGVTVEELADLYESQQISTSQYRDALELLGEEELLAQLDKAQAEGLDERLEDDIEP